MTAATDHAVPQFQAAHTRSFIRYLQKKYSTLTETMKEQKAAFERCATYAC